MSLVVRRGKETGTLNTPENARAVLETARSGDRDRYLAGLFAPSPARDALMALTAFNVELARIADIVSEPMLGEIRLQWWRDALETLDSGGVTGNPVADAVGAAMRAHALPKPLLLGLIDARSFDVSGEAMPDMPALKAYLRKTSGTLFALSARIVAGAPLSPDDAAREAGLAYGLTGLLRALPMHAAAGRLYLPAAQLRDRGVDPAQVLAGKADDSLSAALADLRAEARGALARAQAALAAQSNTPLPAFLPLTLVPAYLQALDRRSHTQLSELSDISQLQRLSRLTWAALRGRV